MNFMFPDAEHKLCRDVSTGHLFCTDVDETALYLSENNGERWDRVAERGEFTWTVDANGRTHVVWPQKRQFRFFLTYTDPTIHSLPRVERLFAESRGTAIEELIRKHNLVVDSIEGDNIWVVHREDGTAHKYCVVE